MKMTESYIMLDDLRFHAYHGVMEQEHLTGNDYSVSLRVGCDMYGAVESDVFDKTVGYEDVYRIVKEEMATPSALVEHVAGRIARRLGKEYPQISSLVVKVMKLNPPMGADCKGAGVELHYKF